MKKVFSFSAAVIFAFTMASCSSELRPFTANLLREGGWNDSELKKVQFYLSNDVILQRAIKNGTSEITSGSIKIVKGEKIEEVRIPRGTPGVFVFREKDNHFAVSFDATSDKRYLMFGPNPKQKGTYVLLASEWQNRQGKVRYDDGFYYTSDESAWAILMVDFKKIQKIEVASQTAKGRKIE